MTAVVGRPYATRAPEGAHATAIVTALATTTAAAGGRRAPR
jgi:hypothetical protein